jgi:hypothetical protein
VVPGIATRICGKTVLTGGVVVSNAEGSMGLRSQILTGRRRYIRVNSQSTLDRSPLVLRQEGFGNDDFKPAIGQVLKLDALCFQDLLDGDYG